MTQRCEECGKRLGLLQRYTHPLDKKKVVCNKCLDLILKGLENYRKCLKNRKHDVNCYFWDKYKHKCKNEKYLKKTR
jgi:hypothetical protein